MNKEELRLKVHQKVIPKLVWGKKLTEEDIMDYHEWIKQFNINKNVLKFYTDKRVLFEIVKYLGNKELCIDRKIRWLYANKIDYLLYNFYFYRVIEEPKSLYAGLVKFMRRERPPYNPIEKKKWQDTYWTSEDSEFKKQVISYDLGFDLDGESILDSYEDAKKLFNFFTKYRIRFSIWCSGKKGWHIIVPFDEFADLLSPFNIDQTVDFCKAIALDLQEKLGLNKLDTIIYSSTRYLRLCYTLRGDRVIFPLTDSEFLNFKEEYMSIGYVLNQKDLGNRGVFCGRAHNPEGFKRMVTE